MDIKKKLREQIIQCRRKMNLAKYIDYGICFAAAGGVLGIFCELFSLYRPFYYAHLTAGFCFGVGLAIGIGYGVYKRADMKQAARRLDSFGMKERMITAWEQIDQETEFAVRQRQDAFVCYEQKKEQIKISLFPDKKHVLALVLSIAAVISVSLIPSPMRDQAKTHHQVQEKAKEEKEDLEDLLEALEGVDMDSLTEEQKMQVKSLLESMQLSKEELAKADSWESLASALERLDYKYEQAGQSLEKLASQLNNPEAAGVASAEALAKAISDPDGLQTASAGTPSVSAGNGSNGGEDSQDGLEKGAGEGSESENGNGTGTGNSSGNGNENGSDSSGGSSGSGSNSSSGEGSGNGSGSGSGEGSGNDGNGNGTGSGRGTGSSNRIHDYVSIPNDIAQNSSLTGNKAGDQNSDYYRMQNGLAWEGEHVDYNSVIGEYTDHAYEGITQGRYPSGMEPVIRDYFENLNK